MHWSNWAGNVQATPTDIQRPGSIDELRRIVSSAGRKQQNVRVVGSGHSFAPLCRTAGLLVDLSGIAGIQTIDQLTGVAAVFAGSKIFELGEPLFQAGRAFANQGDIDRQAIAGAVATGTHGTGRKFGSFSNAVQAIEFVNAEGDLLTIDQSAPSDHLAAAALSLGLLGVVTRIWLSTVPAYKLREQTRAMEFEQTLEAYPEIEASHRNAEFWWIPPADRCVIKSFLETDEAPYSSPEQEFAPGTVERYLKPDKVDWSYRVYPSTRTLQFVECEYTLAIESGPEALRQIRTLMQKRHPDVRFGVEYRTMAGELHLLSPTQGHDAVTISVHQQADLPFAQFMSDCEAVFREHGGRPHWGKLHQLSRDDVDHLFPAAERFRQIRAAYDPAGIFLNDHLQPLFA